MPATPSTGQSVRSGTLGSAEMGVTVRRLGIDAVPGVPWGTHFCQFYETSQDLVDILVPYFQAGLEQNELCMWVTSEPLHAAQAKAALQPALPGLDDYLRQGQLEILDYSQWYTPSGKFDADHVLAAWIEKEQQALQRGFEGLRLTGNTFWLERSDWKDFADYESAVDNAVSRRRAIALCSYAIQKCTATEVIDIVNNHQFALVKRMGRWEMMESGRRRRAEEEAAHRNAVLEGINHIFRQTISGDTQEQIGRLCLAVAENITGSKFGFIGETNPQTGLLDGIAISDPGWQACRMTDPSGHGTRPPLGFKIHGIYGRVLQDGKGFYTNDPSSHPDGIGTPEGHPPLTAFLGVPLTHDGQTIGMVAVGNREGGYREEDLVALEALAGPIVQALMRRRAEEQIQQLNRELEDRVSHRTKQLRAVNESLQWEVAEHIKTEKAKSGLAAIVESCEDAIAGKTLDGTITSWNQAAERMYGYSAAEVIGKSIDILTPSDRHDEIPKILEKIRQGVRVEHFETVRRRKDGQCITVSLTVSPVKGPPGQIVGAATIARDITQRKRLEEEIRVASLYARSLIEASLDPLVTISPQGKITDVNEATEQATGVSRQQLIGSDFSSYFTEPERASAGYQAVLSQGYVRDYPLTIRHVSGRTMDVLYNATLYRNERGHPQGVFAAARDVTDRRRMEEKLRRASLYARSLIEASLDPMVTISPEGKITDVNKATELATGVTRERLIGSNFSSYFTEPERADQGYRRVLADGLVRDYGLTIRHASGQTMDVLYNATVYKNDAGELQGVFAAARDVTEQKASERRQATTNSLLELFVRKTTRKEYLDSAVELLRQWSGCRCVGIRVADGQGGAPYESAAGFGLEFRESQTLLCLGRQACICMRVVSGALESQDAPWLTPAGSFRVDHAARFAQTLSAEAQARCQGACLRAGFLSIAVIPIRHRQEVLGAIQLADEREGMASAACVEFIESMAPLIGEALHRFNAEAELKGYREHLEELVRQRTDELQRNEGLLRSVTDNTEDGIYAKDRHSRLVFVNPAVSRLVGKPAEQILGHTDAEFYDDPAIGAVILENDERIMASGVPQVFEETVETPRGHRVMLSSKVPWRDSQNQVIGIIGVSRDITERKRAEQRAALVARVTSQLLAMHNTQDVVELLCREVMAYLDCQVFFNFLVDQPLGRLRLNACAGIPDEEVRRIEWLDPGVAVCGCVARDGCRIVAEHIQTTPDPRTDLVRSYGVQAYACHPLMEQGRPIGTLSFGSRTRPTFTDEEVRLMKTVADHVAIAMQRIRLLESLERHARAAEAASRAKSQFLANMSHELRTPMNAIMGMIDMALPKAVDPTVKDCLQTAKGSADLLLTLLDDLLDSVRIESGKLHLQPAPFNLRRTLDQIVRVLSLRAQEKKGLRFSCRMPAELPEAVVGDRMRLQQILLNLAGNAIKFTERGEVEIAVHAQLQDGEACLEFAVRDTGIGVPPHELQRIFQPFAQADASMARRFGGTGLGLSIAKSLVEMMGGRMGIESQLGSGSTFHFAIRIPLAQEVPGDDGTSAVAPARARDPLRILLAEDNPANQKVATYILETRGHAVEIAQDGHEALRLSAQDRYDVIVMDVQMPGMNGLEATAAIRQRDAGRRRVPIVAMTAHAMKSDQERCLAAGMDAYLSKPVKAQEMIELIESLARSADAAPQPAPAPAPAQTPAPETVFNPDEAVRRCFNNPQMVRDMIRCFFDEVATLFPQMRAALQKNDLAELGRLGHRMKGTVVYLAAAAATQAAVRVERLGTADGRLPSEAEEAVDDLERQCAALEAVLRTHPLAADPKQAAN